MTTSDSFFDNPVLAPHVAHWTAVCAATDGDFFVRHPWLSLATPTTGSETVRLALTEETVAVLSERTRGDALATAALVLSALSLMLARHTRAETVVVDTPPLASADDRADPALPTVLTLDASGTLGAHLTAVATQLAATFTHQDFPLSDFAGTRLGRSRPASNVLLTVDAVHGATDGAGYDLHVAVQTTDTLAITLTGRAPSCPSVFLSLLATHLERALAAHAGLTQPLAQVELATAEERARLAAAAQPVPMAYDRQATIPSLFSSVAAGQPTAEAVRLGDQRLTYGALERRANALAHGLMTLYGIQPGDAIGVAIARSPLTLVAMLATLKLGAVYVPLDPEYPEERLGFMANDAALKLLLVQSEHLEALMSLYEIPMFALDLQLDGLAPVDAPPAVDLSPDAPAYIIYTSGSTGQPKAVVLAHRGIVNMVAYHAETLGIVPADRLLQFYALSFDSSLFECFMALLNGATLIMAERDIIADPVAMSAYIAAHGVTMLTMPPVYLATLDPAKLGTVQRIISAGDASRVQDALAFAQRCAYYNSYGPTETTVCSTLYRVDPAGAYGSRIPIGTAIANTSVLLLDDALRPVADGIPGELCVAGVSLAIGYLHHDALTAEQFPAYPGVPGGRLYRTGDIAVRRPDGHFELLGRRDNQVKVRGYRIELGEIEAVLSQVDGTREVAVLAQDDPQGRRLVAYVTGGVEVEMLRDAVMRRLPSFMMPSAFHVLPSMPITANGKIDRKALPGLVVSETADAAADGAPTTPAEALLVSIWTEALGRSVGIHDDFFALGGDSILVIQVASRARADGLRITPAQLFEYPTIAGLAAVAVQAVGAADESAPAEGEAPLGPMQRWFFAQRTEAPEHFNQTLLLHAPDGVAVDALQAAVDAVVGHHDALRLGFTREAEGWRSAYAPSGLTARVVTVDLAHVPAGERLDHLRTEGASRQRGFALGTPPLFGAVVYTTGATGPAWLLLLAHHLVIDGVSWRILLDDLQRAYVAARHGRPIELRPRTTSYRGWIARLQEEAPRFAGELPYWLEVLATPDRAWPRDREPATSPRMDSVVRAETMLSASETSALLAAVSRAAADVQDALLTALTRTLTAWTGGETLLVTLERHGRLDLFDDVDLSQTVGWCTSQFPLALTAAPDQPVLTALRSVKDAVRAVPSMGVGFGVLSHFADPAIAAGLGAAPPPRVSFNYLGQATPSVTDGVSWHPVREGVPEDVSPSQVRSHALEVNALIIDGRLWVEWAYSAAEYEPDTMNGLSARLADELRALTRACVEVSAPQFTPADFPAARIDQASLDILLDQLDA
jgi:amino acid adenylation domain-containing protein/non-ribosomal peptide synthase protein (TIGR01720 family)